MFFPFFSVAFRSTQTSWYKLSFGKVIVSGPDVEQTFKRISYERLDISLLGPNSHNSFWKFTSVFVIFNILNILGLLF